MLDGWRTITGEELTIKITKGSSPKWQGFEYRPEGVLFITSENVRNGFLDVSEPKFLPPEFSQKARNSRLVYGDILVNIVGASIGRACQFKLKNIEANVNQAVCVMRLKAEFEAEFFLYLLQAPHIQRRLLGVQSSSARPNLSLTDFRDFVFDLPPIHEQRKIAEILETWDEALAGC
jgi:type I restriction enzyme, S subunit